MYCNKKILILGLGVSGKAVAAFLLSQNAYVRGLDQKDLQNDPEMRILQKDGLVLENSSNFNWDGVDLVIKSPGIAQDHPWVQQALSHRLPIASEIEIACQCLKNSNKTLVGITGSNGKTTTTLLVTHVLNEANISAVALGNIGKPLISCVNEGIEADVVSSSLVRFN